MTRRWFQSLAGAVAVLALAACTAAPTAPSPQDTSTDVPFTACTPQTCSGRLDGAAYRIQMPTTWNGTLLLYSHGYRPAQPIPPRFDPVPTDPADASDPATAQALLAKGYALAGSAFTSNGWAVSDGVAAAESLHDHFVATVGQPRRVLVWGDSLGGLITQVVAEKHPDWVAGAAPMCGAVAGVVPNMELALDLAYAVKTLLYPGMTLTGWSSYQDAVATLTEALTRVQAAAKDPGTGTAALLYIADLVDAPQRSRTYDGATLASRVKATEESLAIGLGFATLARYELEQRFGGNPTGNVGVDYAARISAQEAKAVDAVAAGSVSRFGARLAAGPRVAADPAAATRARAEGGDPQGAIQRPEITLHTAADPLVLVQNETFLLDRYRAKSPSGTDLVQLYTVAPKTYPASTGAPYGAGHCAFTSRSRVAVLQLLDGWVRSGTPPTASAIRAAMGTESGYDPAFVPGPWPRTDRAAA